MVEYDTDVVRVECVLTIRVSIEHEGELMPEELEQIDEQMLELGPSRTGQRVDVTSTESEKRASVTYAYQESLIHWSIENAKKRLDAFTDIDDATLWVDSEAATIR